MPEISYFYGIHIYMYFKDHNPPHFHAEYNNQKALIDIATLGIIKGSLPPKAFALVVEWAIQHREELISNWEILTIKGTSDFSKIEPLK